MDEQGIPQVTNAELIAYLEAILLELRDRLNNYLDLGANDLIAADEGFNFTGQLQATLSDASEHATHVREQLIEIQRKGSE
jgi:lysophospholipase L1-like esterase